MLASLSEQVVQVNPRARLTHLDKTLGRQWLSLTHLSFRHCPGPKCLAEAGPRVTH